MSIIYTINNICSSIRKIINEKQKEQNIKTNTPIIIIERQIGENLMIGLGNYQSNMKDNEGISYKTTSQIMRYGNKYYRLDRFNKEDTKLLYHWLNIGEPTEQVLLEFEKIPPATINYKLIKKKDANGRLDKDKNKNVILQEGLFNYKCFKPIGMAGTHDIDDIVHFTS